MQPTIFLLTLFFYGQVDSNPRKCCHPLQYTMKYTLSTNNVTDPGFAETFLMVDHTQGLQTFTTHIFMDARVILDYKRRVAYMITDEGCKHITLGENETIFDLPCVPENAVFVEELSEEGQTLYVWNYTLDGSNVTLTVNNITCLFVMERIIYFTDRDRDQLSEIKMEALESAPSILHPEMFEEPSDCDTPLIA